MADGQIRRVTLKFERDYTQIPNEWLRDQRLSRGARGLLGELMSHDAGWTISIKQLVGSGPEGRYAIDTLVDELKSHGYLELIRFRGAHGRIEGVIWQICDPADAKERFAQPPLDHVPNFPHVEKPTRGETQQQENQRLKEAHREEHSSSELPTDVSTRAGTNQDALAGADPLAAIGETCPTTNRGHRFDGPGSWCLDCARVREDGSIYDLNGKLLREPVHA